MRKEKQLYWWKMYVDCIIEKKELEKKILELESKIKKLNNEIARLKD